jgi:Hydantoinase/oxoprolinase N-terminal region/Hydantoinase B/oxoprolinase
MKNLCLGIDTGGTFTELVLVDLDTGAYHYHKLPTTTRDPAQGILDGIASIVEQAGVPCEAVTFLVLGTTIATNAVLEGKTARMGMLSTRGFRDILELARQRRPHLFNLEVQKPQPPAARDYRILGGDTLVSLSSERQHVAAQGGCGGLSGAVGEFVVNPGQPDEQRLPSAAADVPLPRGSVLSIRTPSGGFGPVEQRDPQQVERDVREARISEEHAKGGYRWHTPA